MVEQKCETVEIYFDPNVYLIDDKLRDNREGLNRLTSLIHQLQSDSLSTIVSVKIDSYASPEAGRRYNEQITQKRTNSIYNHLIKATSLPDSLITKSHSGIDWSGLQALVERSEMQYRDEVLAILGNTPEETWRRVNPADKFLTLTDSRNKRLMDLRGGRPYRYMLDNFFPQLRRGSVVTLYFKVTVPPVVKEVVEIKEVDAPAIIKPEPTPTPVAVIEQPSQLKFAVKSNLLFDVATVLNIEFEIPIKNKWSIAGKWICPWWVTADNGNALQIMSGQLEGRYWLGERADKPQLTGWFAGVYFGGGHYDLQWKDNGYQGEFYIAAGIAAGYAHTINKRGNLRMEYSLGVGCLSTQYRYYEGKADNEFLVWQHDGEYTWIGPTKAEVSLVWFVNWQRRSKL